MVAGEYLKAVLCSDIRDVAGFLCIKVDGENEGLNKRRKKVEGSVLQLLKVTLHHGGRKVQRCRSDVCLQFSRKNPDMMFSRRRRGANLHDLSYRTLKKRRKVKETHGKK